MSHDTHHGHPKENVTIIPFKNGFWLVVILVGLFVASLNFIQAESGGEGEGHGEATHEVHGGAKHEEGKHEEAKHEEGKTEAKAEEANHEAHAEGAAPATEAHGEKKEEAKGEH
jgi:hypothetical protein